MVDTIRGFKNEQHDYKIAQDSRLVSREKYGNKGAAFSKVSVL